ncbi:DUF6233 domain-containing protein [Streptomyces sp. DT117]|uniref:DUF6233 domain-containing protein n=1 Tax=Streptomyces sp. DT117 TaxID=3393422 RepID=UPI003CF42DE2
MGSGPPLEVHADRCPMAGKRLRPVPREEAMALLVGGLPACAYCRPDTELGIL